MVSQMSSLQTVQGQAADLGSNWSITRNVNFTEEYLRKISNLNADNIRDVANRYFKEESLSVIEVGKKIKLKKKTKLKFLKLIKKSISISWIMD